eukprot:COSAG02_NODE_65411_length_258_cov_0.647799_1_plen_72_part_01
MCVGYNGSPFPANFPPGFVWKDEGRPNAAMLPQVDGLVSAPAGGTVLGLWAFGQSAPFNLLHQFAFYIRGTL